MLNLFQEPVALRGRSRFEVLGCGACPLNNIPDVHKVKGLDRIKGRRAMLWVQNPGRIENQKRLELVGRSGQLLWRELKRVGLGREDFDVQNVVRCWTVDEQGLEHSPPTDRELRCCSVYNTEALERNHGRAHVHLILGEVAGKQLLGADYRKSVPIFWYEKWKAYVVLAYHPSFLLRMEDDKDDHFLREFRSRLQAVAAIIEHPGHWGYVKAQDYGAASTPREVLKLEQRIRKEAQQGRYISVDLEDGMVKGKPAALMIGFGWGHYQQGHVGSHRHWRGAARSVALYHPAANQSPKRLKSALAMLTRVLTDPSIKKTMQHGSYDVTRIQELLGIRVRGYKYDTQYAAYLRDSSLRTYSLDAQALRSYLEFADYKDMVAPYRANLAEAPLDVLVRYNCGDCDLTKRIEACTTGHISHALLQVYIHTAFILDEMECTGPWLDRQAHARLLADIKVPLRRLRQQLCHLAGDAEFNPDSPQQVAALVYDRLRVPLSEAGRSTDATVLATLAQKYPRFKKSLDLVVAYRRLSKVKSTSLVGYAKSADLNDGQVRTIWWLTGAVSGRLRSGKSDSAEAEGVVNLQNIDKNTALKNILVSDPDWRLALAS